MADLERIAAARGARTLVLGTDRDNHTIRKVTPAGTTTTDAGTAGVAGVLLGEQPRFALPRYLAIVGDSLVVSDNDAILLLRHGAR